MIDAVNVPVQTVATKSIVVFGSTKIKTGCSARHEAGTGRVVLLKPGVYFVSFNANVSIPTGGTAGQVELAIAQNGEPIAGGTMITVPAAVESPENIAASVLVMVYPGCCASITVVNNTTQAINVQNANLVVTREC